jgi:hypothetical protein
MVDEGPSTTIPSKQRLIARPRMRLFGPETLRHGVGVIPSLMFDPSISIIGAPTENPGCELPPMNTWPRICGSAVSGEIVCGPVPIKKSIESESGSAFASRIACRNDPGPESLVFVTTKLPA